ncbi:Autophagy 6 isoform 1 [Hibiscus syriacus]|uniref:Autophagy 6 isoform 1 n=1 Tax=Hibiscus syriacus TaxID=106335 RepID=A0A6A2XVY0_HIBSY|nr:Autophagy 6 isoform 1 [Hibiscus syriacus]
MEDRQISGNDINNKNLNPRQLQLFVKLLNGGTLSLQFPAPQIQISHSNATLILFLWLIGGNRVFGSLLRGASTKVGQKKTSNFEACRDMSVRRLRHVNTIKKGWRSGKRMRNRGVVEESVRVACQNGKWKVVPGGADPKKLKIWMGKRKVDESDSDSDDSGVDEEENEKSVVLNNGNHSDSSKGTEGSSGLVSGGISVTSSILGMICGPYGHYYMALWCNYTRHSGAIIRGTPVQFYAALRCNSTWHFGAIIRAVMSGHNSSRSEAGEDRPAESSNSPALVRQGEEQAYQRVPVQDQDTMNIAKELRGLGALEFKGEAEEGPVLADLWLNDLKIMLDGLHYSEVEKLDGAVSLLRMNRSVYEYECEFNKLSRFASELVPTEKEACEWFVEGLRSRLKEMLIVLNFSLFKEVINRAKALERAQNERFRDFRVQTSKRTGASSSSTPSKRGRDSGFRSQARSESVASSARGASQARPRQTQSV